MNRARCPIAAAALALVTLVAASAPAVLPPDVYKERIRDSKVKALAVIQNVEKLHEKRGVVDLKVTFQAAKSFGKTPVPGAFVGYCKAFDNTSGHVPMPGPTTSHTPKAGYSSAPGRSSWQRHR